MADEQFSHDPAALFADIEKWAAAVDRLPATPQPGSDLAVDAEASPVLQVWHSARSAAVGSIDHLQLLKAQLTVANTLHPYALATLGRVAIENAAMYVWLLTPNDSAGRVARRLRLAWQEARDLEELLVIDPKFLKPTQSTVEERKLAITDLVTAIGVERSLVTGRFSWGKIVHSAGDSTRVGGDVIEVLWRIGSGMAHSRDWARNSWLKHEVVSEDGGILVLKMTTNVDQVAAFMWATAQLLHVGDRLAKKRCLAWKTSTPTPPG
ncbi:MAG: hypothetical protein QOJ11_557 [Frankiales bacterium]|jgi:hypothetical protein|nr:hypothetical protein [Frankiales bacterium]